MNLRLSERDLHVLAKCAVCKWLTTSQLQGLYFPHVTLDAVRKSLRRLHEAGYLGSHREHRMAEALHGVGRSAKPLLEAKGLAVELARTPPRQIEHLVGINDMRLAVEVEAERLAYFFAAWELSGLGWTNTLIPDAVFALKPPTSGIFGLEVDCGTEPIKVLLNKVTAYQSGLPQFPAVRGVIFTVESPARLLAPAATMRRAAQPLPICAATIGDIRTSGAYAPVFAELSSSESKGSFWDLCPERSSLGSSDESPISAKITPFQSLASTRPVPIRSKQPVSSSAPIRERFVTHFFAACRSSTLTSSLSMRSEGAGTARNGRRSGIARAAGTGG